MTVLCCFYHPWSVISLNLYSKGSQLPTGDEYRSLHTVRSVRTVCTAGITFMKDSILLLCVSSDSWLSLVSHLQKSGWHPVCHASQVRSPFSWLGTAQASVALVCAALPRGGVYVCFLLPEMLDEVDLVFSKEVKTLLFLIFLTGY